MKVFNTRPVELYKVSFDKDFVGREIEEVKLDRSIEADIQANTNQLQISMYGDRVKNILTMFSNEDIDTEYYRLKVDGSMYQIISKNKYDAFPPTHYVYELEIM